MVLPRPSNKGILIAAVMVGLLGLGATQFLNLDPKAVDDFTKNRSSQMGGFAERSWTSVKEFVIARTGANPAKQLSAKQRRIHRLKSAFNGVEATRVSFWGNGRVSKRQSAQLAAWVQEALKLSEQISLDASCTPKERRRSRMMTLALTFWAAQMNPDLKNAFWEVSDSVALESEIPSDAAKAAGLRLITNHDLWRPNEGRLLAALREFTKNHPSSSAGADVYVTLSQEIKRRGNRKLARRVAELGTELYTREARGRLLNQMIEAESLTLPVHQPNSVRIY